MRKLKLDELERKSISEFQSGAKFPLYVVLDNIRSGLNVGSVFRTCDAFAVKKLILTGICPRPPHKEIHKSAIGATASVDWDYYSNVEEAVIALKQEGIQLFGLEQTTESVLIDELKFDSKKGVAIVLGNEVDGISDTVLPLLEAAVEIPQYGTKHSLNVSVCAGVGIWHFIQKLSPKV